MRANLITTAAIEHEFVFFLCALRLATTCEIDGKWGKNKGKVAENYNSDNSQLISDVTKPEHTNCATVPFSRDLLPKTQASLVTERTLFSPFSDRMGEIGGERITSESSGLERKDGVKRCIQNL